MIHDTLRGGSRPKLALRYGATRRPAMAHAGAVATAIPALELRRLVAAMVD